MMFRTINRTITLLRTKWALTLAAPLKTAIIISALLQSTYTPAQNKCIQIPEKAPLLVLCQNESTITFSGHDFNDSYSLSDFRTRMEDQIETTILSDISSFLPDIDPCQFSMDYFIWVPETNPSNYAFRIQLRWETKTLLFDVVLDHDQFQPRIEMTRSIEGKTSYPDSYGAKLGSLVAKIGPDADTDEVANLLNLEVNVVAFDKPKESLYEVTTIPFTSSQTIDRLSTYGLFESVEKNMVYESPGYRSLFLQDQDMCSLSF